MTLAPTLENNSTIVQETAQETVRAVQETAQETVQETAQEAVQEAVQDTAQECAPIRFLEIIQETTPEWIRDIILEGLQETVSDNSVILDEIALKLAGFILPEILSRKMTSQSSNIGILNTSVYRGKLLKEEIKQAIIAGLEQYSTSDHPQYSDLRKLLENIKVSEVSNLTQLTIKKIEENISIHNENIPKLLSYKFVFSPENIKEYFSPHNYSEYQIDILTKCYSVYLLPEIEPKGFEDYPSFEEYLSIIGPKVLEATKNMDFDSATDMIPHIPSPLALRYSKDPVPPRIMEMISERLWPLWKTANPPTTRYALSMLYSIYIRFTEEKKDDEEIFVRNVIRKLGLSNEMAEKIIQVRKITDECFWVFRRSYFGDGRVEYIFKKKPIVTDRDDVNRIVILSLDNNVIFEHSVTKKSFEFLSDLLRNTKTNFKFDRAMFLAFQNSTCIYDIKYLDLARKDLRDTTRDIDTLIKRIYHDMLPRDFFESLEEFAPLTFKELLNINYEKLTTALFHNMKNSHKLALACCSREMVKDIFFKFAIKPSLETLRHIDFLFNLKDTNGQYLINCNCFFVVAETIISKGLTNLVEPAELYLEIYCMHYPEKAMDKMNEYVCNKIFSKDIDPKFMDKMGKYLPNLRLFKLEVRTI
jgi:hypothetical protein